MKSSSKSRGASTKQPNTGNGNSDKGITYFMSGKDAAKAAYARTTSFKPASNKSSKKK